MEIKDFNIQEAFISFRGIKRIGKTHLIIVPKDEFEDFPINKLPEGYAIGCEKISPGSNENKSQFSTVEHNIFKGTKKWVSKYILVWDSPISTSKAFPLSYESKGEAVTKGRELTEKYKRTCYVILGKSPEGFERDQAKISYKPSQRQTLGLYEFKIK